MAIGNSHWSNIHTYIQGGGVKWNSFKEKRCVCGGGIMIGKIFPNRGGLIWSTGRLFFFCFSYFSLPRFLVQRQLISCVGLVNERTLLLVNDAR